MVRVLALILLWVGFDSWTCRHMWVEFVIGFRCCSEGFFSLSIPIFLPPQHPNTTTWKQWTGRATSWNVRCIIIIIITITIIIINKKRLVWDSHLKRTHLVHIHLPGDGQLWILIELCNVFLSTDWMFYGFLHYILCLLRSNDHLQLHYSCKLLRNEEFM